MISAAFFEGLGELMTVWIPGLVDIDGEPATGARVDGVLEDDVPALIEGEIFGDEDILGAVLGITDTVGVTEVPGTDVD